MKKIFIDGSAGTTGLRLEARLRGRKDLTVTTLPEAQERDTHLRTQMLNEADVAFLCLPDEAARHAVALTQNPDTVLIDTSTAHRTASGWAYGFPELGFAAAIRQSRRVAVPGCHAGGFVALIKPLVLAGILSRESLLHCLSLTGYTGAGREAIARYEAPSRALHDALSAPWQYALEQNHKHLPEMRAYAGLDAPPVFCPVIADFPCGMEVTVPLHGNCVAAAKAAWEECSTGASLTPTRSAILDCYQEFYANAAAVLVSPDACSLSPDTYKGRDSMELSVAGNDERMLLIARFDNLGKGASGAAVQCMNLVIGAEETEGLVL